MPTIIAVDPLPTLVICCTADEVDAESAALMAALYTLTTTGTVASGEARPRCVAGAAPLEVTA